MDDQTTREHLDQLQQMIASSQDQQLTREQNEQIVQLCARLQEESVTADAGERRAVENLCMYVITALETLGPGPDSKAHAVLRQVDVARSALRL